MNLMVNVERAKRAIKLFHQGKVELMRPMLAEDVVWKVPHSHPLAADIVGIDNVLDFFRRVQTETEGSFSAEVLELVGNDRHIFCLMHVRAKRGDRTLDQKVINVWKLRSEDGKVYERELYMEDQPASDEFWAY